MKKERKSSQTTVKMPPSLRSEIDKTAKAMGISTMEFIRRACVEKIERGRGEDAELRARVIRILRDAGVKVQCD